MIRVADYIARFLVRQGVRDIFVLTGNGAMYLNDAFTLQPELKYYCARNEAAAPMMAEAYARIKGSLGAVCLTSGPGSTNAIPGLAEAWVDSAPIMILSGQVQRNHTSLNAGVEGLRSFGTAEINIVPIVSSLTKYAVMINEPESIRYHLEKAAYLALHGRPGPVWIDVPMDVQYAMIDETNLKPFIPDTANNSQNIDSQIDDLVELIFNSQRPLLVAGQGVRQSGAIHEFKALVEELNAPVMFSMSGLRR
jgi:acetolactate synthase-1/2/3 large subunit